MLAGLAVAAGLTALGLILLSAGPGGAPPSGTPATSSRQSSGPAQEQEEEVVVPPEESTSAPRIWSPPVGTSWQWQLSGTVDTTVDAAVFDIDGAGNTAETVAILHAKGARVICYIDAGGWENYRSDAAAFPEVVKGNPIEGWPDERWLDIRRLDILLPIMEARVKDCAAKGFDAVEPDLVDGFTNDTGFPLTYGDQLIYNRALAELAHRYGLGVGLKNDPEQVTDLISDFDFAIVEECVAYDECQAYLPFIDAGKAVLHAEYEGSMSQVCAPARRFGFSTIKKRLNLGAYVRSC